eukprot:gene19713-59316_t
MRSRTAAAAAGCAAGAGGVCVLPGVTVRPLVGQQPASAAASAATGLRVRVETGLAPGDALALPAGAAVA